MNLRFVEAFHWAVSLGSVTRAAQKLHITQSALSARISALEEELGTVLVDRRDKQFRLTIAGQRFHTLAQQLLSMQRQIKEAMGHNSGDMVTVRIGAIESVVHSWLPRWLVQMRADQPDFAFELTVETSPVLVDQVRRGALDLVFAAIPANDAGLRSVALPAMQMSFVGHQDMHLARRYRLNDLACLELLTFQRGSQPHQALLELFQGDETPTPRIHTISSISAMVQLVEAGFGVATLPSEVVSALAHRSPLRALPGAPALAPLPIHASYREDPTSTLTESLLASATAQLRSSRTRSKP
ncbi:MULTISPECIES: LysR family transcriptional regulator [Hydrogenophaga]|jgi:DNA-binding transcriptional LysR family regulator|uniref:LysR family transcriptional regulator n=1 Tax=Hydrogenophaga luteola TaxID=1591122 RepID=A0ABV7W9I6_9BURK|nr:LysR family transcriptional regulator [Hydrogenophaga flava]